MCGRGIPAPHALRIDLRPPHVNAYVPARRFHALVSTRGATTGWNGFCPGNPPHAAFSLQPVRPSALSRARAARTMTVHGIAIAATRVAPTCPAHSVRPGVRGQACGVDLQNGMQHEDTGAGDPRVSRGSETGQAGSHRIEALHDPA